MKHRRKESLCLYNINILHEVLPGLKRGGCATQWMKPVMSALMPALIFTAHPQATPHLSARQTLRGLPYPHPKAPHCAASAFCAQRSDFFTFKFFFFFFFKKSRWEFNDFRLRPNIPHDESLFPSLTSLSFSLIRPFSSVRSEMFGEVSICSY